MKIKALLFVAMLIAVFALHRNYLQLPFAGDDFYFFRPASEGVYGAQLASWLDLAGFWSPVRGWYYRPVFLTYFSLVSLAAGPTPMVFHALGLVLHAAVVAMLGWLIWRLTRGAMVAVVCSLAFLLWPGKAEAVWMINSHSTLLASLFSLASVHCWLSWKETEERRYFACALFCFWLALCSKNDAASLPAALLMIDAWYELSQGKAWRQWLGTLRSRVFELAPIGALLIVFAALELSAARSYALYGDPGVQSFANPTAVMRLRVTLRFIHELWLGLLPLSPPGIATILAVAATVLVVRRFSDGWPVWLFLTWGVSAALPVPLTSGLHALCERFVYLPAMPAACAAVFLALALAQAILKADRLSSVHLFVLSIAIPAIGYRPTLINRDPTTVWPLLFFTLAIAFVLWRAGRLSGMMLWLLTAIAAGTQLTVFAPTADPLLLAATLLLAGVLGWRREGAPMVWCAPLFVCVLWYYPVPAIPLALAGAFLCELLCRFRTAPATHPAPSIPNAQPA